MRIKFRDRLKTLKLFVEITKYDVQERKYGLIQMFDIIQMDKYRIDGKSFGSAVLLYKGFFYCEKLRFRGQKKQKYKTKQAYTERFHLEAILLTTLSFRRGIETFSLRSRKIFFYYYFF